MELAARVDKSFNLDITAIKQKADERIIIIQFGVGSDDYARARIALLLHS